MARLPQGVRRRDSGGYEKRITIDGKRYSIYGGSLNELKAKEEELKERIKEGSYVTNANLTLNKFYDEWKEERHGTIKVSSENVLDEVYNLYFRNGIGKRRIWKIEQREIVALQKQLAKHLKPTTVNGHMVRLKSIFNAAVKKGILVKSPCLGVGPLMTDECSVASETIHRALTEEEMWQFLGEVKDDWLYPFFCFSFFTGLRIMEIGALTWNDIDYEKNVIHVTKTLSIRKGGFEVTSPKSKKSKRDIPLTAPVRKALKQQKENVFSTFGGQYVTGGSNIFVGERCGVVSSSTVRVVIIKALERLEKKGIHIERFSHHACRDTFATMYLRGGGKLQTLKTILGHASLAMTADLYAHVLDDTKQEEMDKVALIFTKAAGE